jgi:hypothetical protein
MVIDGYRSKRVQSLSDTWKIVEELVLARVCEKVDFILISRGTHVLLNQQSQQSAIGLSRVLQQPSLSQFNLV